MLFGIGDYARRTMDDFKLPNPTFYFDKHETETKFYIGLQKWGALHWVRPLVREKEMPAEYFKRFNAIELDATHYKIHEEQTIRKWTDNIEKDDFLFCPKMYKGITHFGGLKGKEFKIKEALNSYEYFERFLGPIFIALPESFSSNRVIELVDFLKGLPTDQFDFFLELRHESWFSDPKVTSDLCQTLKRLRIGFVITDTPVRRDLVHMHFPLNNAFVRFGCEGDHLLDFFRIEEWSHKIKDLRNNGFEKVFFFLHVEKPQCVPSIYDRVLKEFSV